ncbi:MAG: POTRA domain-containing protein, partial [Pseudomonadota bacterium]
MRSLNVCAGTALAVVLAFAVDGIAVNGTAVAQTVPPGTAIPGTTRDELQQPPQQTLRPGPDEGQSLPSDVPDEPDELDPQSELSFLLNGVDIRGATVYEPSDFDDILEDFIGTEISLGGLREIGNRIERRYRRDGFVATRVIVPPQAIREGLPTLQIFEGKIIHYEINGEIGEVKKQIAR